jgi:hypothetical protein
MGLVRIPPNRSKTLLILSALSWYFLNLFGLNGVFKLILGADNGTSTVCMPAPS